MITIGVPSIAKNGLKSRLVADISIDGVIYPLWFEVERAYEQYLCNERSDAFLLGLFHYAMIYGHDILCEAPLTRRLYEALEDQFLPAFYKINNFADAPGENSKVGKGYRVQIKAPLVDDVMHPAGGDVVATGCSCGVDSLHVFASHSEITHGCIWNLHGVTYHENKEIRDLGWGNIREHAEKFCKYTGKKLIIGDTNYDRNSIPNLQFDGSTTFANLFCIFALQKLWNKYYIASGYDIEGFTFKISSVRQDPADYEFFLFPHIQLKSIRVYLDGVAQRRIDKIKDLTAYEPSYHFLNVCWGINDGNKNCSYLCPKCMRTMLGLDVCGALDLYKDVFDVQYYRKHLEEYLAELYKGCIEHNPFMLEMKDYFDKQNIPFLIRFQAFWICSKKAFRKIFRGGSVNHGKFSPRG